MKLSEISKTVVVMADTHAKQLNELPHDLVTAIKDADYVVHLGDFTSFDLLQSLRKLGNFCGVTGNHDDINLFGELKRTEQLEVCGKKLGLIHGLIVPIASRTRMRGRFRKNGQSVQAILYGHTHIPTMKRDNGVFFFNPGTVAGKFPAPIKSFGRLHIDGTITGEIVVLDAHGANGPLMYPPTVFIRNLIRVAEAWF
jgi:uncharacterized protein